MNVVHSGGAVTNVIEKHKTRQSKRVDYIESTTPRAIPSYATISSGSYYSFANRRVKLRSFGGNYYRAQEKCDEMGDECWGFQTTFGCEDRLGCSQALILEDPKNARKLRTKGTTVYAKQTRTWDAVPLQCTGLVADPDATQVGECEENCTQDADCEIYQWMQDGTCLRGSSQRCQGRDQVLEGYRSRPIYWAFTRTDCDNLKSDSTAENNLRQCQDNCEWDMTCEMYTFDRQGNCRRGQGENCREVLSIGIEESGKKDYRFKWKSLDKECDGLSRDNRASTSDECKQNCADDENCSIWQFMKSEGCFRGQATQCSSRKNPDVQDSGYRWYIGNGDSTDDNTDDESEDAVPAWGTCDEFSVCESGTSCRAGDNRCLTDENCAWANDQDSTSRDCTPLTRPQQQCSTHKFGLDFCNDFCNNDGIWGCGLATFARSDPRNTQNVDYTCDCSGCNSCGTQDEPEQAPEQVPEQCPTHKFGLDFCNDWCNNDGIWGCGLATFGRSDPRNTDDVDYTCDCSGCNGCDGRRSLFHGLFPDQTTDTPTPTMEPTMTTMESNMPTMEPTLAKPEEAPEQCSTDRFGLDFCNDWCNNDGFWGCGLATLGAGDARNTDDVDYTCDCSGCNGCDGRRSLFHGLFPDQTTDTPTPTMEPTMPTKESNMPTMEPTLEPTKPEQCSSDRFGLDFCNDWCNNDGFWGCGLATLGHGDPRNTDDVDYTCDCTGCNGCGTLDESEDVDPSPSQRIGRRLLELNF